MSFILNRQIFDKIHHIWIDGIEIVNSDNKEVSIEITVEAIDDVNDAGKIIIRAWKSKYYCITYDCHSAMLMVDENKDQHNICFTGMGWRSKPNKNRRIAKKWSKKYGKQYRFCSVNITLHGDVEIT